MFLTRNGEQNFTIRFRRKGARMLNLPRLRMLRELHRLGTLAEVARTLNYTPSAVSQQLGQLERETGVALLEHVGRNVRLTPGAVALVGHTEAILARMEQAEAELAAGQHDVVGTVRLAAFDSAVLTAAPLALDLLAQRHPGLDVEITQREVDAAHEGLLAHDFDIIIGEEYDGIPDPVHAGVRRQELARDPLYLVLPLEGPWSGRPETLADLAEAPWSLDPPEAPTGRWARALCRAAGFEPKVRMSTVNPLLQIQLARTGHAATFIPALMAAEHLAGTRTVGLPGNPRRLLYFATRSGRTGHPGIVACREAFEEAIRRELAPPPDWDLR